MVFRDQFGHILSDGLRKSMGNRWALWALPGFWGFFWPAGRNVLSSSVLFEMKRAVTHGVSWPISPPGVGSSLRELQLPRGFFWPVGSTTQAISCSWRPCPSFWPFFRPAGSDRGGRSRNGGFAEQEAFEVRFLLKFGYFWFSSVRKKRLASPLLVFPPGRD